MIDSLKGAILGFQRVIAASAALCVKKFSQPHQGHDAEVGPLVILQPGTELFVNHPIRKPAVRPVG
jgi:hypothetical protein